jgi:spore coat polysaccharide biosynthesis predicted glycosyltransferase SpsG
VRIINELSTLVPLEAHILTAHDEGALRILNGLPATIHLLPPRNDPFAVKPLLEAGPVLDFLQSEKFDLIALDMLDTPEPDMTAIAATGVPLITFDDRGPGRKFANAIINILVTEPEPKALPESVELLEGGDYVVLDPAFNRSAWPATKQEIGPLKRVFVTMGGADAAGLSVKVARALCSVNGLERVEIIAGPAFPHRAELEAVLTDAPWQGNILSGLPTLMECYQRADFVAVAGGLAMYEVCFVGMPALAVAQPIDHQYELAERLSNAGAMATIGWGVEASVEEIASAINEISADPAWRQQMSQQGMKLVDGEGTRRVAETFLRISGIN